MHRCLVCLIVLLNRFSKEVSTMFETYIIFAIYSLHIYPALECGPDLHLVFLGFSQTLFSSKS